MKRRSFLAAVYCGCGTKFVRNAAASHSVAVGSDISGGVCVKMSFAKCIRSCEGYKDIFGIIIVLARLLKVLLRPKGLFGFCGYIPYRVGS